VKGGTEAMRKEREISRRLFLAAVSEGEGTRAQIMERSGLSSSTFRRVLNEYRDAKTVRVCRWINRTHEVSGERLPGQPYAVYALNPDGLDDAPLNKRINPRKVVHKYYVNTRAVQRAKALAREGKPNMFDQLRYSA
jgi:hypothetical protein